MVGLTSVGAVTYVLYYLRQLGNYYLNLLCALSRFFGPNAEHLSHILSTNCKRKVCVSVSKPTIFYFLNCDRTNEGVDTD